MQNKNKIKTKETCQYRFMRVVSWLVSKLYRIQYHGVDVLNSMEKPFIIVCNHRSGIDPLAIANCIKDTPVHYIGKKELEKNKFTKSFFSKLYMIPIDRKNTDLRAIKKAIKVIKEGGILGIFPEGTRHCSGDMQEAESGVAVLIQMCKTKVLPVYIDKKFKLFRKSNLYFLEPMDFEDILNSESSENKSDLIMSKIKDYYKKVVKTY